MGVRLGAFAGWDGARLLAEIDEARRRVDACDCAVGGGPWYDDPLEGDCPLWCMLLCDLERELEARGGGETE